jgi:hypothetical protein
MDAHAGVRATARSSGDLASRLLRAGLLTGVSDGLFASVASVAFGSNPVRLFQGVAATLFGPSAIQGGTPMALVGVLMHFVTAFWWSAVFLILVTRVTWVRRVHDSPSGVVKIASVYGPLIWLVMSLAVIPTLVRRPPAINARWWVQLVGHAPFVGLPIAWGTRRR